MAKKVIGGTNNSDNSAVFNSGTSDGEVFVGFYGNDDIYAFKDTTKDGGHDTVYGGFDYSSSDGDISDNKDYLLLEAANDGSDFIDVGSEDHSLEFLGSVDDYAVGGSDTDYLFGVGRTGSDYVSNGLLNLQGWDDDSTNPAKFRSQALKGIANGSGRNLNSDVLLGGSGRDLYVLGASDTVVERNPENDVIYKIGAYSGRLNTFGSIAQISPKWSKKLSYNLGSEVSYYNTNAEPKNERNDSFPEEISQGDYTEGNELVSFEQVGDGERSTVSATVNFPGIVQNDQGDVALRFQEGVVILSGGDPATPVFIRANENGKVLSGDFGFEFPTLAGFEANTDQYYIGGSQWVIDIEKAVEAQYPGLGRDFAEDAQEWLRYTIFPLVDPYHKALVNDTSYDEYYSYLEIEDGDEETPLAQGTEYGLRYDDDGLENYDDIPVSVDVASVSSEETLLFNDDGSSVFANPTGNFDTVPIPSFEELAQLGENPFEGDVQIGQNPDIVPIAETDTDIV